MMTSFEITFRNQKDSKNNDVAVLRMRQTESLSTISESSITVPFQSDPPTTNYDFYGWLNIGQLASALKKVVQNDKIVIIAFDSEQNDQLIIRYEPHPNKPGMKSTILRDILLKFSSDETVPSSLFMDTEFEEHSKSVYFKFNIQPMEFNDNISLIQVDKTGNDQNQKLDPDNEKLELIIYYICPNFTWIKTVVENESCSSMCQMMCPNSVVHPEAKPILQRDLIFEQTPLYRAKFLHKRFFQFLNNFKQAAVVHINIAKDPNAPINLMYMCDTVTDETLTQFNYLRYTIVPKL
jgi:hypothetical protein